MKKFLLGVAVAALSLAASTPASAASFLFNFTAGANASGSGTFTTADIPNGTGGYAITNTVGSITQGANTLSFTGPTAYAGADNLLYAFSNPVFSFDGTSVQLTNGTSLNFYFSSGYKIFRSDTNAIVNLTSFTVTPTAAAVPEPASWAMMIGGCGIIGGALRASGSRRALKTA